MELLNTRLLAHPFNWLFVLIVAALAMMAFGLAHDAATSTSIDASITPD